MTRENKVDNRFAYLAGVDRGIRERLEKERKERLAKKEEIKKANPNKKIMFDPFVGYIVLA